VTFDLTISTDDYPTPYHFNYLRSFLGDYYKTLFQSNEVTYEMFKSSFTLVFIEMDDLKVTSISEIPSITPTDLLASLGGTLGLFVGYSILSLAELMELLIGIIFVVFQHLNFISRNIFAKN
jgi:hypothetical protein